MKLSTRYQAKGIFRVARGTLKEFAGKISSNSMLGVKGKFDRLAGKVQWKIGKAQGVFGL
ncbi:MAG: CsbD family protein [Desulfobacteraceae bacterium]|nr:CsbD family protein [Desulfobacteraceae bacterium]